MSFFLEGSFLYFAFKIIFLIILAEEEEDGQTNLLIQPK
jgi:hypothetical protein